MSTGHSVTPHPAELQAQIKKLRVARKQVWKLKAYYSMKQTWCHNRIKSRINRRDAEEKMLFIRVVRAGEVLIYGKLVLGYIEG
jgi:hypothetical protein